MSTRKPISKSTYDDDSSNDISESEPDEFTDMSFFSGTNPTEPGVSPQMKIPKYTKEDEEEDYEEDIQIKNPPPRKVPPKSNDIEEDYDDDEKVPQNQEKQYSEKEDPKRKKYVKNKKFSDEEDKNEEEEEEEEISKNTKVTKPAPSYKEEEDEEDVHESNKSSSSPAETVSERFSTSVLPISSNGLNALEAKMQISSSSDDSSNNINQRYKLQKQKMQEKQKIQEKQKKQEKQENQEKQKKVRMAIESSNEPNYDSEYSDNYEDAQSRKNKDDFSHSQTSRRSHISNFDKQSQSSKRHFHATYSHLGENNNQDDFVNDEDDNDQEIRRRHSAKSIASSHKSLRSTRSARSTKSTRSTRSTRTEQTNPPTQSKRSSRSRQSITKDTWKEDVAKSVAQKENDRINIILATQYHINPEEIEIEIQEKVKKEYEDMLEKNCKTIYQNKEMLKADMNKNHYLDLDENELKKYPRSKIREFNELIKRDIDDIQKKLNKIQAENKMILNRIKVYQTNSKEADQNQKHNRRSRRSDK